MTILILGSEGFIGSHLVAYFLRGGHTVHGCDLYDGPKKAGYSYTRVTRISPEWEEVFGSRQFDCCVNAAGSGNVPYSMTHPLSDFESNTLDTMRALDTIRRLNKSCRYLHISSAAVYGNPERLPISEQDLKHPLSPYGWNKLMAENVCSEYHTVYGVATAAVRPFSVYGNGLRKQLIWDICKKLQAADSILLFGTGTESRDFIHISDLVLLIDRILQQASFTGNVFNGASGTETTIREIADLFETHYGNNKKIDFSREIRKGDPLNWRADVSKINGLGFYPAKNLEQGMQEYITWFGAQENLT